MIALVAWLAQSAFGLFNQERWCAKWFNKDSKYIPRLWCPKMQIIYTVEIHVFRMPCKRSLPHTKIKVRGVDTENFHVLFAFDHVQDGVQVIYVPAFYIRIVYRASYISTIYWRVECNVLPVWSLHLLCVTLWRSVSIRRRWKRRIIWEG